MNVDIIGGVNSKLTREMGEDIVLGVIKGRLHQVAINIVLMSAVLAVLYSVYLADMMDLDISSISRKVIVATAIMIGCSIIIPTSILRDMLKGKAGLILSI